MGLDSDRQVPLRICNEIVDLTKDFNQTNPSAHGFGSRTVYVFIRLTCEMDCLDFFEAPATPARRRCSEQPRKPENLKTMCVRVCV